MLQGPNTDVNTLRRIKRSLVLKRPARVELLNYSKDGQEYWLDFTVIPLVDKNGEVSYFGAIERDITQQKISQDNLYNLANKDYLTGAINRHHFYAVAAISFANHIRRNLNFAIMIIDVDSFKHINDTFGHLEGDKQLKLISSICLSNIRQTDYLCRFGGDEFMVLLHGVDNKELIIKANSILTAISNNQNIKTSVSIGATLIDKKDTSINDLIARADLALYRAKEKGKENVCVL
ncbi:sensory box protein [Legionella beliardensis]|uniref:Sensory box protein n=2 Tax=Legionella beliardensis TaxID=91822 RepID=A0A378JPN4_9GAMM|nr:GGDEF domain-containing protein [Legionella beliardensis]STX55754.1 sensory box protein [Legionella beliardensis]